jgi:hypothetical protein
MPIRDNYGSSFSVLGKMLGTVMMVTVVITALIMGFLIVMQETPGEILQSDASFLFWVGAVIFASTLFSALVYSYILQEKIQWSY